MLRKAGSQTGDFGEQTRIGHYHPRQWGPFEHRRPIQWGVYERLPYCAKVSETVTVPAGGGLQGGVRELGARLHPSGPRSGGRAGQLLEAVPEGLSRGARVLGLFCLAEGQKTRVMELPGGRGQGGSRSFSELLRETIDQFWVRERLGWTQEWKMAGHTFPRGIYFLGGRGQAPDQVRPLLQKRLD